MDPITRFLTESSGDAILFRKMNFMGAAPEKLKNGINDLEATIGSKLPNDYKLFLQKVNGGTPKGGNFDNGNMYEWVNFIFGVNREEPENIISQTKNIYLGRNIKSYLTESFCVSRKQIPLLVPLFG